MSTSTRTRGKPNILLIIADDLGKDVVKITGVGSNRKMQVVTREGPTEFIGELPNISLLLRNGLFLDQAWAQPACSPTRASLYTGTHPWKNGIGNPGVKVWEQPDNDPQLDPSSGVVALPKILPVQYACGLFGKWHLGDQRGTRPTAHGWDKHVGTLDGTVDSYYVWTKVDSADYLVSTHSAVYVTKDTVDAAADWINHLDPAKPWFVTMAFHAPHSPFEIPPGGTYDLPYGPLLSDDYGFNAMAQNLDFHIGKLIGATPRVVGDPTPIPEEQLQNTVIIFVGDNGSDKSIALEESKTTIYEGGVRVPLIIADGQAVIQVIQEIREVTGDPNHLRADQLNRTSYALSHVVDLYKTIAEVAQSSGGFPANMDSVSLTRLFMSPPEMGVGSKVPERTYNFSQYFWKERDATFVSLATIRNNAYKLNYDSRNDPPYQLFEYEKNKEGIGIRVPGRENGPSPKDLYVDADTGRNLEARNNLEALVGELKAKYQADDEGGTFPDVKWRKP